MGSGGKMDGDEANTMHPAKYSMMGGGHTSGTKLAMAFYGIYGLGFFVALNIVGIYGIGVMPLFPFRIDDLDWSSTWLIQTIFDYYGCAFCICGVIICTEPNLGLGIAWVCAICFGGCPFACLWGVLRLIKCNSLRLAESSDGVGATAVDPSEARRSNAYGGCLLYALYGLGFFTLLIVTNIKQPLFPIQIGNRTWCNWWLMTTVFDYYGCCIVYAGIILSTEQLGAGIGWVLGVAFVGTPASCVYVLRRLWKFTTLGCAESPFKAATMA